MSLIEKMNVSSSAQIVICIAVMLFVGFFTTRITKKLKLPNVTAYITAGILIGPYVLNLIPNSFIKGSGFLADVSLAIISFGTGQILKLTDFKKNGIKTVLLQLMEAVLVFILVFVFMHFILRIESVSFCILLSSIALATSNAATMMIIRQTNSKGNFVNNLLEIIALDNILAIIAYSISIELVKTDIGGESMNALLTLKTIGLNLGVTILGGLFGLLLKVLMPKKRTNDNRLIIVIAMLFTFCGICLPLGQSPLLGCMAMGIVYNSVANDDKLFMQLNYFSPPILLLFFVRSGVNVNLGSLVSSSSIGVVPLIVISISYAVIRLVGKYGGIYLGSLVTKSEKNIKNYLGLGLISQGAVAIGLCSIAAREIGGEMGSAFETIIIASSVIYEFIGPAMAKLSLYLSKSYSNDIEEITNVEIIDSNGQKKSDVDILIERINEIKNNIPAHEEVNADEEAFIEAAQAQAQAQVQETYISNHRPGIMNRRR